MLLSIRNVSIAYLLFSVLLSFGPSSIRAAENYQKALQLSNYFFECQESGQLSPGNRVPWRGPAHCKDGQDVGRDLSGGWYDAGDHWKSNYTMGRSAWQLAMSCITWPEAYQKSNQMDELQNNLTYICDYFLKCVVDGNPDDIDNFSKYEIYIDIGGKPGPAPGVHSVWASPEVVEGYTVRESLKTIPEVPAIDVVGNMAATLASSAIVFHRHGDSDQQQYAMQLMQVARKMAVFQDTFFANFSTTTVQDGKCMAVAPDGEIRAIAYRDKDPYPYIILSHAWLHLAEKELNPERYNNSFLQRAIFYEQKMAQKRPNNYSWWTSIKPKYAAMILLKSDRSLPSETKDRLEQAIKKLLTVWVDTNPNDPNGVTVSPGGLHYRKNQSGAFTFSVMLKPALLAAYWHSYNQSDSHDLLGYVKSQMDYLLGNNPSGKSYMIGYDNDGSRDFWKVVHHRGAYGAWRSFEHFVKEKPIYRPKSVRHTLYGGVLLGNNAPDDSFRAEVMHHYHTEVAIYANASAQSILACLLANGYGEGEPFEDNEFPPKAERNNNTDIYTTDREFFVIAKLEADEDDKTSIIAELHNRSRWPARKSAGLSFRYYFTLEEEIPKNELISNIVSSSVPAKISQPIWIHDKEGYVEIHFPGDSIAPFAGRNEKKWSNYRTVHFTMGEPGNHAWDRKNDFSNIGISAEKALIPTIPVFWNDKHVGGEIPPKH